MPVKKSTMYTLGLNSASTTPSDSTAYHFGNIATAWKTTADTLSVYVPVRGVIRTVTLTFYQSSGTAEDVPVVLRLNASTDYAIETIRMNATKVLCSNLAMNVPVVPGDRFEIKVTCPAWVTNPTGCLAGGDVLIASG